jgi:putative hydrolase of the HAD superfamily
MEHLFFDAAGTLFRVRGSVGRVYLECALEHGFQPEEEPREVEKRLDEGFRRAFAGKKPLHSLNGSAEGITVLERRWWLEVVAEVFRDYPRLEDFDAFFADLYERFRSCAAWEMEPGCEALLQALRQRGRRLGVITNFDSRVEDVLSALGIRDFFETVTISSRSSAAKPDVRIFAEALAEAGASPDNSLHVGDHPEEDYRAARRAGLRALLYDPHDRCHEVPSTARIRRLTETLSFLI